MTAMTITEYERFIWGTLYREKLTLAVNTHMIARIDAALAQDRITVEEYDAITYAYRRWLVFGEMDGENVRGCSCGMADYGAPGHDGLSPHGTEN